MNSVLRTLVHVGYYDKKYYKNKKYDKYHGYYNDKPRYQKAADIIMAVDIGVTAIMPVPPAGKP